MAHRGVGAELGEFTDEFFPRITGLSPLVSPSLAAPPSTPTVATPTPSTIPAVPSHSRPRRTVNPFKDLKDAENMLEKPISEKFTSIVNDEKLVPGLKLCLCGDRPDPKAIDDDGQKIDAALYRSEVAPDDGRPHWADQLVAIEFKRHGTAYDPFEDNEEEVVPAGAEGRTKIRGQIITYAELIFSVQQRVALFMLVVFGRRCRFIRWDRSGTIVTKALDYYEEWEFFCDVLERISGCSDEQLGLDPTATRVRPDDEDYKLMDSVARPHPNDVDEEERLLPEGSVPEAPFTFAYVRRMFADSLQSLWPRYCVEVPCGDGPPRKFLICKPVFRAKGMAGRGTRGYVAFDLSTGRFVWLKDAWRAHYILLDKEGDVLGVLRDAGVKNIPTLVCHGDIGDQETLTPRWWERKYSPTGNTSSSSLNMSASNMSTLHSSSLSQPSSVYSSTQKRKRREDDHDDIPDAVLPRGIGDRAATSHDSSIPECPLRLHKHYRLVEEEVAMRLTRFKNGQQLLILVYDCVVAHQQAATLPKPGILHRDVSGSNILIYPRIVYKDDFGMHVVEWTGLLADWEMSKPIGEVHATPRPRQPERTGTWQFMSVALLSRPKPVEISDELEAFLYVVLYYAFRYLWSNCSGDDVANYIDDFFDTFGYYDGTWHCGAVKSEAIKTGQLLIGSTPLSFHGPLDSFFDVLLTWFSSHYAVQKYERELRTRPAEAIRTQQMNASRPPPSITKFKKTRGKPHTNHASGKGPQPPTEDKRQDAAKIVTHNALLELLQEVIEREDEWRMDDKVGDRIPVTWKTKNKFAPGASTLGSKRAKYNRVDGVASLPLAPQQFRKPVTPPRAGGSQSLGAEEEDLLPGQRDRNDTAF